MLSKRIFLLGLFLTIFIFSCKQERQWKVFENFPNGNVKIQKEYKIEGTDSLFFFYQKYNADGSLLLEGPIIDDVREGLWISYYPNGKVWSKTTFKGGISDGESISYYQNGHIRYSGYYKVGEKTGEWQMFDSTGTLVKKVDLDSKKNQ
jgi:antitoxin component YwqK of YwqJK toxin-antitoxin module